MAVLQAFTVNGAKGGAANVNLSSSIASHGGERDGIYPIADGAASFAPGNPLDRPPINACPRPIAGGTFRTYANDWYHRLHIAPQALDLGNVVSTQVTQIQVWNAFLSDQNLLYVDGLEEGVEIIAPMAMPFRFPALKETEWSVVVTPDGPSSFDARLIWVFDGLRSSALRVTGNRIVPWGFAPDWSTPITERLAWLTDILANSRGAEQRRSLRIAPRKSYEARFIAHGAERAFFDLAMASWGRKVWALPIWPDVQQLDGPLPAGSLRIACRTSGFDFRKGGLAMLRGETAFDTEAVEIEAIDAGGLEIKRATQKSWPALTRLYPVRSARLAAMPETLRRTASLLTTEASFDLTEPADWPAHLPATMYRGRPVFEARPDETEDLTRSYERLLLTLDNQTGVPMITDTAVQGFVLQQHNWALAGRAAQASWRSLVYGLRGRAACVWVPTHAPDLQLAGVSAGGMLVVQTVGYARFGLGTQGRKDIRLELVDGTVLYRRITAAVENGAIEELLIDVDLPRNLTPGDVARVSYMALCRLSSDEVSLRHLTDADGHAAATAQWRGVRDDLEGAV